MGMELLVVGLGGALGSCARYLTGHVLQGLAGTFPLGTFAANVAAGLVIGFLTGVGATAGLPDRVRLLLVTGLCGGLSTFSTFSLETVNLAREGAWGMAMVNVVANVAVCCVAVLVGMRLAQLAVRA